MNNFPKAPEVLLGHAIHCFNSCSIGQSNSFDHTWSQGGRSMAHMRHHRSHGNGQGWINGKEQIETLIKSPRKGQSLFENWVLCNPNPTVLLPCQVISYGNLTGVLLTLVTEDLSKTPGLFDSSSAEEGRTKDPTLSLNRTGLQVCVSKVLLCSLSV